ncbi:YchJ family protein [Pseudoalteromonas sp. SSDWG2]|uniref:YchJ family protein n=1 Tax=Pseudoalteromonas sp. SSDWG2 TaxID=3139391 RepID=UPI003BAC2F64
MCFCGSPQPYEQCCGVYILGGQKAPSPLALMKSRYSAFCTKAIDYLCDTCSTNAIVDNTKEDVAQFADVAQFVNLEIVDSQLEATPPVVEFKAYYLFNNTLSCIHERSSFVFERDQWCYDKGVIFPSKDVKVNRNDPCPCGSSKKFKKCCAD